MAKRTHHVFVYGTLMNGERNHHLLVGAKLISKDVQTKANSYFMEVFNSSSSLGKYTPAVKQCYSERAGAGAIQGEIYEIDDDQLAVLDELEQNDVRYKRKLVQMKNGSIAYMYLFIADDEAVAEQRRHIIESTANHAKLYQWKELPPVLSAP